MNPTELEQENKKLKRLLTAAKTWMGREIKTQMKRIASGKMDNAEQLSEENIEEITNTKIADFFGEILLLNIPADVTQNIISAEVNYHNLKANPNFDGLGVISGYHKALDSLIESFITKGFRKFAHKQGQTILRKNEPLEKSLNSVVNRGYILSTGRLYHLLSLIESDKEDELYDYGRCFRDYLDKYYNLKDILLSGDFISCFKKLMGSETLGKKRHIGKISLGEVETARKLLIGDFKDKNCLIYGLIETQKIDY